MAEIEKIKLVQYHIQEIKDNSGNYIVFGGKGILDGLAVSPCKHGCYRIQDADETKITLKGYGQKHCLYFALMQL